MCKRFCVAVAWQCGGILIGGVLIVAALFSGLGCMLELKVVIDPAVYRAVAVSPASPALSPPAVAPPE